MTRVQGKQSRRQAEGSQTESSAEALLCHNGLRLVTRNYQCRNGEIDLIMLDRHYLVFVEVRLRSHSAYVSALESVDRRKQGKLIRTAQHFLLHHPEYNQHYCRFDVVASHRANASDTQLTWIKDAFQLSPA